MFYTHNGAKPAQWARPTDVFPEARKVDENIAKVMSVLEKMDVVLFERTLVFADDAARAREAQHNSGEHEILLVERSRLLDRGSPPFRIEPEFVLLGGLKAPGGRSGNGDWALLPRWHVAYSSLSGYSVTPHLRQMALAAGRGQQGQLTLMDVVDDTNTNREPKWGNMESPLCCNKVKRFFPYWVHESRRVGRGEMTAGGRSKKYRES